MDINRSLSTASSAADVGGRVVNKTKIQYENRIKLLKQFYEKNNKSFVLPLESNDILAFFGSLSLNDKPMATSTVGGYKSAIGWYYKENHTVIDDHLRLKLESFLAGYKRKISALKLEGKMAVFEGKHHLTFNGYLLIAKQFFKLDLAQSKQMLFGWAFLLLQWNLMSRSVSVSTIMLEHISWEGDSLLITTPKHKGDQEGANCYSKHLYANPSNPFICPILALAILIFTQSFKHDHESAVNLTIKKNFRLFDGKNSENRFSELLGRVIASFKDDNSLIHALGAEKNQLGTHSIRKGAVSYCNGMMSGPSMTQIFLRAGWSPGNVQDRYLFAAAGGDQLTGRTIAGLPFTDVNFAVLPPHFTEDGVRMINWVKILPMYENYPNNLKQALPYLLASIINHEEWLKKNLSVSHPLFSSYLFASGEISSLKGNVINGIYRNQISGMIATGIPPHLTMSNELKEIALQTNDLRRELLQKCDQMPAALTETMLSKFSVNGAIPLTMADMVKLMADSMSQLREDIRISSQLNTSRSSSSSLNAAVDPSVDPRFITWTWGGQFHMVPEGWKLPTATLKEYWNLWHYGNVGSKIRPLRYLKQIDLVNKAQVVSLSKVRKFVEAIETKGVELKLLEAAGKNVKELSQEESSAFFDVSYPALMEQLKPGSTTQQGRWTELSSSTVYKLLLKIESQNKTGRKRRREEEQNDVVEVKENN